MVLALVAARQGARGAVCAARPQSLAAAVSSSSRCAPALTVRQLSYSPAPQKPSNSKLPGVIYEPLEQFEPKPTGFLAAVDKLGNNMFMGEIFRGMWLSLEVRFGCILVVV